MSDDTWKNVHAFSGFSPTARPSEVEHPDSIRFMLEDLAKSGLEPLDLSAYPVAPDKTTTQYCIPYPQEGMYRLKRDVPISEHKYHAPYGRNEVWFSPHQDFNTFRSSKTLMIVEGEKKAAKAVKTWPHIPVLGIGGIWNGTPKSKAPKATDTYYLHPTIQSAIAPRQKVIIVFDNDIIKRKELQKAAYTLYKCLMQAGTTPVLMVPPGSTKGLDDYLVSREAANLPPTSLSEVGLVEVPFGNLEPTKLELVKQLKLIQNEDGSVRISGTNYRKLLEHWLGTKIYFDKRLGYKSLNDEFIETNTLECDFLEYLEQLGLRHHGTYIDHAFRVFKTRNARDSLMDEIDAVKWDGLPRLSTWGNEYIKNKHNYPQLSNEWGRLLITALVMRLRYPGTKFDYVMYLIGPQGIYKTSFFEKLAQFKCGRFYGTIQKLSPDEGSTRTLGATVRRNIVFDFAESTVLDGRAGNIEYVKSFITATEDEFREVYAKEITQLPRQFILVGTSNKHKQLYDTTGSRRFAMLDVQDVVIPLPYETKMQLIAEVLENIKVIKETPWYQFNLKWDDLPQEITEELMDRGYTPNVNLTEGNQVLEGLNQEHIREDPITSELRMFLEMPEAHFATHLMHRGCFISTNSHLEFILKASKRDVYLTLNRLKDNPNFPWKINDKKPATMLSKSLICSPTVHRHAYVSDTNNSGNFRPIVFKRRDDCI